MVGFKNFIVDILLYNMSSGKGSLCSLNFCHFGVLVQGASCHVLKVAIKLPWVAVLLTHRTQTPKTGHRTATVCRFVDWLQN